MSSDISSAKHTFAAKTTMRKIVQLLILSQATRFSKHELFREALSQKSSEVGLRRRWYKKTLIVFILRWRRPRITRVGWHLRRFPDASFWKLTAGQAHQPSCEKFTWAMSTGAIHQPSWAFTLLKSGHCTRQAADKMVYLIALRTLGRAHSWYVLRSAAVLDRCSSRFVPVDMNDVNNGNAICKSEDAGTERFWI